MRDFTRCLLAAIILLGAAAWAAEAQSKLMRFADVHKGRVVFTFEGDLWWVPTTGGAARRLTRHAGGEVFARFSPDGQWIAFTAGYDGGNDVYVMPATGGVPRRLTWHPARDHVLGWTPDGAKVLFRSRREYPSRADETYVIGRDGGMPEKLPIDRGGLAALSPDGKSIVYNRISREFRNWKRYQGGMAQDLWMGSLEKKDYRKITDWPGTDNWPMWSGEHIYYTSDREDGVLNLYKQHAASGQVTRLTKFTDYDVKYPSIGPDKIVFQYAGGLHLLDLKSEAVRELEVMIPSDRVSVRERWVSPTAHTGAFGLSPQGDKLLLETRGEIVVVPVKKGEPVNLTRTSGSREKNAAWSPEGDRVAFISDKTGEEELYLVEAKKPGAWKQLTTSGFAWRMAPVWSPDGKWLVFADKFMRLNLVEVATGEIRLLDKGNYDDGWERWGIRDYSWSPDSKWIAYAKQEANLHQSIFVYSLGEKQSFRVTSDMTQDWSPAFDPTGRYLYFLSERTFEPTMGRVDQNHIYLELVRPYIAVLRKDDVSPFAPKQPATGKKGEKAPFRIDFEGLEDRVVPAKGVMPGNYFRLEATPKGFLFCKREGRSFLKYQSITDHTRDAVDLYHYMLDMGAGAKVIAGIQNYHLSADGKRVVYRAGTTYGVIQPARPGQKVGAGRVNLTRVKIKIDPLAEFKQIFDEAWRVQRDWFYDPGLHGVDWKAAGARYRSLIPHCGNRSDLNYLIGEMIAELACGHTYIYGGDTGPRRRGVGVGLLGAEFEVAEGSRFYRVSRIVPGLNWDEPHRSPLAEPGCPVKVGHYLVAIDGEPVRVGDNVYRHLENKMGHVVELSFNLKPERADAFVWRTRPIGSEMAIRYREWVDGNRRKVAEVSGGKLGYVHIPNMGEAGCIEFARAWYPQCLKLGMVIDVRYNGGGFTGDMLIDRIERRLWSLTQPREGKTIRNPERCFHGHLVVLMNEDTGSNGEYFSEAMKLKGLATLVGMRTWGGAVGIEPHQLLVDGATTTPPQFAPFGLDGKWMIEGTGVVPEIEVQNMPRDVVAGKDEQLEVSIGTLLRKIAADPKLLPKTPPFPVKTGK